MAGALRVAAVLTGTLALNVEALASPPPYNLRATYFVDGKCSPSKAFLIQEYYFPKINQCVMTPSYPPPEAWFPTSGMAWSVVSCNSTAAVVSVCNKTCGNCRTQTMPQQVCMPMDGGGSQIVNFTCTMDPSLLPASTGRPVSPCYAAQVNETTMCKVADDVDTCDPTRPCSQSLSALWGICPGSAPLLTSTNYSNVAGFQTAIEMQCMPPCTAAYSRVSLSPYCGIDNGGMCYTDCLRDINATLELCNNTFPTWANDESQFAGTRAVLRDILTKCAGATMPPPPPSTTAAINFTYFKDSDDSLCTAADAWPNATSVTFTYNIGQNMCVPGPWAPGYPAGSYYFRFDACNGQRVLVADCDANCSCGEPYEIQRGVCWQMAGYRQLTYWDRCPVPTRPTTTTMPPATTMMPPPDTTPPNTTMMPPPPPVIVSGSMTVKAATQEAANALVADPQVRTAFAMGIASIAGVDFSIVNVSLSVGARRLGASGAAPLRRLDAIILVSYIITLPANGTSLGGAPPPSPNAVKTMLTNVTPAQVQASVTAAYLAMTMNGTPPSFTVNTVVAPTVMYPTTTTTIGAAGGAEWGARPWLWLAGLLALASAQCAAWGEQQ